MDQENAFLFWTIAGLTGICAIAVVVTQNIVRAAAWLLFTLGGVAGIYFLIGADFVGATQLIVYVGGILVLVVFGVMLTAQGPFITMRAGAAEWAVALVVGTLLFGALAYTTTRASWTEAPDKRLQDPDYPAKTMNSTELGLALLGFKDVTPKAEVTGLTAAKSQGGPAKLERKQMAYLLPFEIISVHLLVVLIGAAYLARAKRRRRIA
jgi:NADH-quinone oxidoreductase subunit J